MCKDQIKLATKQQLTKLKPLKAKPTTVILRQYQCDHCKKSFTYFDTFMNHNKEKHGKSFQIYTFIKRCFKCVSCDIIFNRIGPLKLHVKAKHKIASFQCNYCEKSFSKIDNLDTHKEMTHEGLSINKCSVCNKSFYTPEYLKIHHKNNHLHNLNTNATIIKTTKKYKCQTCDKIFREHEIAYHMDKGLN